jgi:hypothetical protein
MHPVAGLRRNTDLVLVQVVIVPFDLVLLVLPQAAIYNAERWKSRKHSHLPKLASQNKSKAIARKAVSK